MDLPTRLKFFKKLGLYQELENEDKRRENSNVWHMEKILLRWVATEHDHLHTRITSTQARDEFSKLKNTHGIIGDVYTQSDAENLDLVEEVFGNLVVRRFAIAVSQSDDKVQSVRITPEGRTMAEVVFDCQDWNGKSTDATKKYQRWIKLTWFTTYAGITLAVLLIAQTGLSILEKFVFYIARIIWWFNR